MMKWFGKSGFSLVEILVGMVIAAIAMVGVMKLTQSSQRAGKGVSSKLDFDSTGMLITRLIANGDNCTQYFANLEFVANPATLDAQVIGDTSPALVVHMPGAPASLVAKRGETLTGTLEVKALTIQKISLQSPNNYLAKLRLEASDRGTPNGIPLVREFPLELVTADAPLSVPPKKKIVSCTGLAPAMTPAVNTNYTTIARHSFTITAPSCPAGWDLLWTGYSFAGLSGDNGPGMTDLGGAGSCVESYKPQIFTQCYESTDTCDYGTLYDVTNWLTTSTNAWTGYTIPFMLDRTSRCAVCGRAVPPLLVRHKLVAAAPPNDLPDCPPNWSEVWAGYSLAAHSSDKAINQLDLNSVGSCIEIYKPLLFYECASTDRCDYKTPTDSSLWLTTTGPADETPVTGIAANRAQTARCRVCQKTN